MSSNLWPGAEEFLGSSIYISRQNYLNTKDINIKITNNNDNNINNVDVEERRPILG